MKIHPMDLSYSQLRTDRLSADKEEEQEMNEEAIRIATTYEEDFGCMLHAEGLKNGSAPCR